MTDEKAPCEGDEDIVPTEVESPSTTTEKLTMETMKGIRNRMGHLEKEG